MNSRDIKMNRQNDISRESTLRSALFNEFKLIHSYHANRTKLILNRLQSFRRLKIFILLSSGRERTENNFRLYGFVDDVDVW